jgi:hypothetical protein
VQRLRHGQWDWKALAFLRSHPNRRAMSEWWIRKWSHVAWNDSRAGSLNSPALGGVERKEHPTGIRPSIGSSNKRPQLPGWGRCFDIRLWPFKVLVEGDHAIAAVRLPLAMVLVAVAASQRSYPPVR